MGCGRWQTWGHEVEDALGPLRVLWAERCWLVWRLLGLVLIGLLKWLLFLEQLWCRRR